jgi:hypothetical protein
MNFARLALVLGLFGLTACAASAPSSGRSFREPAAWPMGASAARQPEIAAPAARGDYAPPPAFDRIETTPRAVPMRVDFDCWRCGGR